IDALEKVAWEKGSISEWVNESHELARDLVYPSLPAVFSCSGRITGILTIGEEYYSKAAPMIETQIRKAGIRLARVLNEVFSR
ncbi:MAG TPA: S1/P1 nuclease, partial [Pyrinomonadaceae bacterium]|nr:S1/P1 nuclease [Pyrinomonadaceae bacterium]